MDGSNMCEECATSVLSVGRLPEEEAVGFTGRRELICKCTRRHARRGSY